MNRHDIEFPARHAALRDDVHVLGGLVGDILREQGGDALLDLVERDRVLAIQHRAGDEAAGKELEVRVRGRPPATARDLVRAFSAWFQAVNLAEKVHRIRRRKEYFLADSARPQPGGVEDALAALKAEGASLDEVLALLAKLRIEPVFTAHPTESTRRTILRKQQRVAEMLLDRLDPTLTPQETRSLLGRVRTEMTTAWQTEDHPRDRLTVADEREHVMFYIAEVLYRILPAFYDEIALALEKLYGVSAETIELPLLIRFGSWVGGDMDGNPDVNAKTIRETLARQHQVIVNAYFGECQHLAQILSQSASRIGVSPALAKHIERYMALVPGAQTATPARHDRMPYRVFLGQIGERLRATYDGRANAYENPRQLLDDLGLIAGSLGANKGRHAGLYLVRRLIRRVETFGFHFATLDVRQHAGVHHRVLAQGLDDPQWLERPSAERHDLLVAAIERDLGPRRELDALGKRAIAVFEAMMQARHRYGRDAIGYYIVSASRTADDVLAPLLVARWAETYDKVTGEVALDLAPLFESIDTLAGCGDVMRQLLADPLYFRHLEARGRRQCVMVGYSDTNKDGGLCASRIAAYRAEQTLAATLTGAEERHVIFHGRGGSIARGGGRIDALVRAAPPESLNGVLRLTEQGEVINQNYGLRPIALRTLERAFNALALGTAATLRGTPAQVAAGHMAAAQRLADTSRAAYRALVHDDPGFFAYFRAATPIDVIERMQIGSRPAWRDDVNTLEALRPVPWVFAWTQSRCMLPGWFGAGTGLAALIDESGAGFVREACTEWFFFHNLIDDVETMLARTDLGIAGHYDALAGSAQPYFARIAAEYSRARDAVLAIKGCGELLDGDPTLQRSIRLRNPYVDPMNLMQVDLLARWRATKRQDRDLYEALLASISGIAQGLQSTG
ncbi:MAG TPA: phosphoenolpyruvate carboxylase [Steroidobacteraceae bacterium]|nr:phosphoenolpyruvate carboxylase [Steroidobacteraceae bacterium]